MSNNQEIGLWATPASWHQRYPHQRLDFLSKESLGSLLTQGWAIFPKYANNPDGLFR